MFFVCYTMGNNCYMRSNEKAGRYLPLGFFIRPRYSDFMEFSDG